MEPRDLSRVIDARMVKYFRHATARALYYFPAGRRFAVGREDDWPADAYRLLTSDQTRMVWRKCGSDDTLAAALVRTRCVLAFPDMFHDLNAEEAGRLPNSAWSNPQERAETDRYIWYAKKRKKPRRGPRTVAPERGSRRRPHTPDVPPF